MNWLCCQLYCMLYMKIYMIKWCTFKSEMLYRGAGADMEKSGREWVMPPPFSTIYLNRLLFEIYKYTVFFWGGGTMLNIIVKFDLMNKFKKRDTTFYTSIKNWTQNLVILCNRGLTFNIIESAKIKIFPIVTVNCIQNKQSNPKKVCNATNII